MTKSRILVPFIALLALAACGKDDPSGSRDGLSSDSTTLGYDFEFNHCPTGNHQFSAGSDAEARRQLCAALQNDALNNHCAYELRRGYFEEQCPGQTWQPG